MIYVFVGIYLYATVQKKLSFIAFAFVFLSIFLNEFCSNTFQTFLLKLRDILYGYEIDLAISLSQK